MLPPPLPAPLLLFLTVHLYTLGLRLLGGELNLCSSGALLHLPVAQFPSDSSYFRSSLSPWGEKAACYQDPPPPIRPLNVPVELKERSFDTGARGRAG